MTVSGARQSTSGNDAVDRGRSIAVGSGTVNATRHALPSRDIAPKFAIVGLMLLGLGLVLAFVIASNIGAANARDLPTNIWFFDLGRVHPEIHSTAEGLSWFADGVRNIVVVPVVTVVLLACRQWRWAGFLWFLRPRTSE